MASESPSTEVTAEPTVDTPLTQPSAEPSAEPSTEPSAQPSAQPSTEPTEYQPLLGGPGGALQRAEAPIIKNLWLGTGWLAQIGAFLLVATTWSGVFTHPLLALVSPHPLLQSLGVFLLIQAILILQPTVTPQAKLQGQRVHASLHLLSFLVFLSGVAIIETNKHVNHMDHFHSVHGYLGTATAILLVFQYTFGFLMWAVPSVFGGVNRAKATWKYHRYGGYALLILVLATVISAVDTDYNKGVLDIKMWVIGLSVGLILIGVYPRIQIFKLGFERAYV